MSLSRSARRVQEALAARGLPCEVVELPASTRTAKEAAAAVGCAVAQIAKSIVFRKRVSGEPLLVVASGSDRIDETRLAEVVGEPVGMADPGWVRERTGFAIGGVPPLGHERPVETLVEQNLLRLNEIWAAAGTPHAVLRLRPEDLVDVAEGRVIQVAAERSG